MTLRIISEVNYLINRFIAINAVNYQLEQISSYLTYKILFIHRKISCNKKNNEFCDNNYIK